MDKLFARSGGGGGEPSIPYHSPPSIGHELGVMFGFIVLMLVCSAVYAVIWQAGHKRSQQREADRIAKLRASGLLKDEKANSPGSRY